MLEAARVGANKDLQDVSGMRLLVWAARRGNAEIVQLLLQTGADLEVRDQNGDSTLDLAIYYGTDEILDLLSLTTAAI